MTKALSLIALALLTTSCAAKYESFVEGDKTTKGNHVVSAVSNLVDSYTTTVGGNSFRLHPAKRDTILIPALEQRLRESGHSVVVVRPKQIFDFKQSKKQGEGIDLRYRASYVGNIGTYCLGIGESSEQMLCRMYDRGKPISSITATGVKAAKKPKYIPVDENGSTGGNIQMVRRPTSPQLVPELQVLAKPTQQDRLLDDSTASPADELNIIQTAHLDNDQLRSTLERYVAYLPPTTQISFTGDRQEGETEEMYRSRLLKQMKIIYSYQYHQGIGYE